MYTIEVLPQYEPKTFKLLGYAVFVCEAREICGKRCTLPVVPAINNFMMGTVAMFQSKEEAMNTYLALEPKGMPEASGHGYKHLVKVGLR